MSTRLKLILFLGLFFWIALISVFIYRDITTLNKSMTELAVKEAESSFNKDLSYRRWASSHGGVYAPVDSITPPNPHLAHIKERDIVTPSGKNLTLINPAYMTRQVHQLAEQQYSVKGHITSLNPLRPENKPDSWEAGVLTLFEKGINETHEFSDINGHKYLRYMHAMKTETSCLKCHASQGYKVGDVRGGISVSVPWDEYAAISSQRKDEIVLVYCLILCFSAIGFSVLYVYINKNMKREKLDSILLKESEERYRLLADNSIDTIWLMDPNGNFLYHSPSVKKLRGLTPDEANLIPLQDSVTSESFKLLRGLIKQQRSESFAPLIKDQRLNVEMLRKDGSSVWTEVTFSAVVDSSGKLIGYQGSTRDISERMKAQRTLFESETKFRVLFEHSIDAISVSKMGIHVLMNQAYVKMFGYKNESELIGKPLISLIAPAFREEILDKAAKRSQGEYVPSFYETKGLRKDNSEFDMEVSVSLYILENDTYTMLVLRDTTERNNMIREITEARDQAEEMNRIKSNFYANMSHELRTPMIGILGFSEMLLKPLPQNDVAEFAAIIHQGGLRLMETLNLILHMSRIESGKINLNFRPADIISIINAIVDKYSVPARQKSLFIKISSRFSSILVNTDADILKSILNNLMSNAVKYTFEGGIEVIIDSIQILDATYLTIEVKDTGIGISKEHHEIIWEQFRQVSEGMGRSFEGTGLGLSIARDLAFKLNCGISVESELDKGSVFRLTMPISPADMLTETPVNQKASTGEDKKTVNVPAQNVLYVEDDPVAVSLTRILLKDICTIDVARNSAEAVIKAESTKYAAILMDINLGSGPDGIATAQIIRGMELHKEVPIIAITAYASNADKEEFLASGCTHYLSKPYANSQLVDMMNGVLN